MKTSMQTAVSLLAFATSVLAIPGPAAPAVSSNTTSVPAAAASTSSPISFSEPLPPATSTGSIATAHGGALDFRARATATVSASSIPAITTAPSHFAADKAVNVALDDKPLTISILNQFNEMPAMSISYGSATYVSGTQTVIAPPPVGNPPAGVFATSTVLVMPSGWAGRMTLGKAGSPLDYRGSKIEANYGFNGADPAIDVDVSYVDGYSLPIVCSCDGVAVTGCSKPLFHIGNTCANLVGTEDAPVCVNDPRNAHGPATAFFAPCSGSAYTFDYDDGANSQGACESKIVNCCIGNTCSSPARQPAKRGLETIAGRMAARRGFSGAASYAPEN